MIVAVAERQQVGGAVGVDAAGIFDGFRGRALRCQQQDRAAQYLVPIIGRFHDQVPLSGRLLDAVVAGGHAGAPGALVVLHCELVLLLLGLELLLRLRLLLLAPSLFLGLPAGSLHSAKYRAADGAPGCTLARIAACQHLLGNRKEYDRIVALVEKFDKKPAQFWFDLGERLEERRRFDVAEDAYKKAFVDADARYVKILSLLTAQAKQ